MKKFIIKPHGEMGINPYASYKYGEDNVLYFEMAISNNPSIPNSQGEMLDEKLKDEKDVQLYKFHENNSYEMATYIISRGIKNFTFDKCKIERDLVPKIVELCSENKVKALNFNNCIFYIGNISYHPQVDGVVSIIVNSLPKTTSIESLDFSGSVDFASDFSGIVRTLSSLHKPAITIKYSLCYNKDYEPSIFKKLCEAAKIANTCNIDKMNKLLSHLPSEYLGRDIVGVIGEYCNEYCTVNVIEESFNS